MVTGTNLITSIEKCPSMIHDRNYHGRVSFIGHSVGGLIIRKCLEVMWQLHSVVFSISLLC